MDTAIIITLLHLYKQKENTSLINIQSLKIYICVWLWFSNVV